MNDPSNCICREVSRAEPGERRGAPAVVSRRCDYYLALAREQARAGDMVQGEDYSRHAEHFFRAANLYNS
jgi:hypothetical protein